MWSGNALHFTSLPHPTCFWEILIPLGALLPTCPHPSPWPWSQPAEVGRVPGVLAHCEEEAGRPGVGPLH